MHEKKIFLILSIILILAACTSDIEKAKNLGFTTIEQMQYVTKLGYKNQKEFIDDHPIQINSDSKKFIGVGLGLTANLLGIEKKNETYKLEDGYFEEDKDGKVFQISTSCDATFKSKKNVTINGIGCSSSSDEVKNVIQDLPEYCSHWNFEDGVRVYLKENAFYGIDKNGMFTFGLAQDPKLVSFWETYYRPCEEIKAERQESINLGFESAYEMKAAFKEGIKNGKDWKIAKLSKKFKDKYASSANTLEKSLVVLISSPSEFQSHKDNGGLNVVSQWRGYQMYSASVEYTSKKLTLFHVVIDTDYSNKNKAATINNIKNDLIDECGTNWRLLNSEGNAYVSDSEFSSCEVSSSRSGGFNVVVSVRTKNIFN